MEETEYLPEEDSGTKEMSRQIQEILTKYQEVNSIDSENFLGSLLNAVERLCDQYGMAGFLKKTVKGSHCQECMEAAQRTEQLVRELSGRQDVAGAFLEEQEKCRKQAEEKAEEYRGKAEYYKKQYEAKLASCLMLQEQIEELKKREADNTEQFLVFEKNMKEEIRSVIREVLWEDREGEMNTVKMPVEFLQGEREIKTAQDAASEEKTGSIYPDVGGSYMEEDYFIDGGMPEGNMPDEEDTEVSLEEVGGFPEDGGEYGMEPDFMGDMPEFEEGEDNGILPDVETFPAQDMETSPGMDAEEPEAPEESGSQGKSVPSQGGMEKNRVLEEAEASVYSMPRWGADAMHLFMRQIRKQWESFRKQRFAKMSQIQQQNELRKMIVMGQYDMDTVAVIKRAMTSESYALLFEMLLRGAAPEEFERLALLSSL